mmetsp:Transcript_35711/g.101072  ORF Transcript_35711/g.101072 Transcript_35711/m.101072 type:complete len:692 (-) Transcript_35711:243-2318(-)
MANEHKDVESGTGPKTPKELRKKATAHSKGLQAPLDDDLRVKLEFVDINSWAVLKEDHPPEPGLQTDPDGHDLKQILFNISGACNPGELMGIMGPSGSGKSTLMSMISGRPSEGMIHKGSVTYNGNRLTEGLRMQVAFVPQDDLLHHNLTVYETLYYAARLALPEDWSKEDKVRQVEEAMEVLGLTHRRDTPVVARRKTVSGGERKRVSVAHEMLTNPSVLFLDEPTSGLDSTAALILVKALKKLARRGRTVIATIHQPNAHTFSGFDKLMVLSRGESLYYGHRTACLEWFKSLDAPCPPGINTAEYVIDVAACFVGPKGVAKTNSGGEADPNLRRNELVKAFGIWMNSSYAHVEYGVTSKDMDQGPKLLQTVRKAEEGGPAEEKLLVIPTTESTGDLSAAKKAAGPPPRAKSLPWFEQFGLLYSRIVASRRAEAINFQKVGLIVGWGILAGILWAGDGMDLTVQGANNVAGLFFLLCLQLFVQNFMAPIFMFPQEMAVVKKERSGSLYSLSAYYLARSASEFQLECLLPVVQATLVYIFALLRPSILAYLATLAVVITVVIASQGLGHLFSTGIRDPDTRSITFALATQFSAMVCGFVLVLPLWINWAKYLSVLWYGYNLLLFIQYEGVPLQDCASTEECQVVSWTEALSGRVNPTKFQWLEIVAFIAFVALTRFAAFSVLKFRTTSGKA